MDTSVWGAAELTLMARLPHPVRVDSLDAISKLSFGKLGMAPKD